MLPNARKQLKRAWKKEIRPTAMAGLANATALLKPHARKLLAVALVLAMISGLYLAVFSIPSAEAAWYNTSWDYRKSHVINAATGTGTNYTILLHVVKGSGTDTTETYQGIPCGKVYLGTHVQDDFDDLRFTDNDGITQLDHYRETFTSGTDAYFWIKVMDDISSSSATIYIYYGYAEATSASNGDNTFLWFSHFDSSEAAEWAGDTDRLSFSSSKLNLASVTGQWKLIQTTATIADRNVQLRASANGVVNNCIIGFGSSATPENRVAFTTTATNWAGQTIKAGTTTQANSNLAGNTNLHMFTVSWTTDRAAFQLDGTALDVSPITTNVPTTSLGLRLGVYNQGTLAIDYLMVRKYVVTEPTQGAFGAEENKPAPWAVTFTSSPELYGTVDEEYSYEVTTNTTATLYGDTIPAWATFTDGVLSGTPTEAGSNSVSIRAVATVGQGTSYQNFTIEVADRDRWAATFSSSPDLVAYTGDEYTYTPTTNETATITAITTPGWGTYEDGSLTGTPTEEGSYSVSLRAESTAGTLYSWQNFTIVVTDQPVWAAEFTSSPELYGTVDEEYSYEVATNETASYTALAKPAWATFNTTTGLLIGTPTEVGQFTVSIRATSTAGTLYSWQNFTITVTSGERPPTCSGDLIYYVDAGSLYNGSMLYGNPADGNWTVAAGPSWLSIVNGEVIGHPGYYDHGEYRISLLYTNANGSCYLNYTLTVNQVSIPFDWPGVVSIFAAIGITSLAVGAMIDWRMKHKKK